MKYSYLFLLLLSLILYIACNIKNMTYYKGNFEILLSSGEFYSYDNNILDLKFDIKNIFDKHIPNVDRVLFFSFYKNGILTIASEYDNDRIYSEKLTIYFITDDNKRPEEIMKFHGDVWGHFFLYDNILYYYFDELIAIDLNEHTILWKVELEKNVYVRNIFIDIESRICIFSSNDYYIKDYNKNFVITATDNSKEPKLFHGILLTVDKINKCVYYLNQDNDLLSHNYETNQVKKIIFSNNNVRKDLLLNRIYVTDQRKYIICYAKKSPIIISKIIFPGSDFFLYDYSYFFAAFNGEHLEIVEEIVFDHYTLKHEQIKNIREVCQRSGN